MDKFMRPISIAILVVLPSICLSAEGATAPQFDLTHHWVGYGALGIFFLAYVLAMLEEATMLRKSKPMVLAASIIWVHISVVYVKNGMGEQSGHAFRSVYVRCL